LPGFHRCTLVKKTRGGFGFLVNSFEGGLGALRKYGGFPYFGID
jgi:hypothetical protein